jgi:hypothetical protein
MRHDSITVRTDELVSGSIYNHLRSSALQAPLIANKGAAHAAHAAHAAKLHPCLHRLACAKDYYGICCAQCSHVTVRLSLSVAKQPRLHEFERCLHTPYSKV